MRGREALRRLLVLLVMGFLLGEAVALLRGYLAADPADAPRNAVEALAGPVDGFTAMVRPPAINVVTYVREGPVGLPDYVGWVRRDESEPPPGTPAWLTLSLLLGAGCGLYSGFQARHRVAWGSGWAFWTAAGVFIGPLAVAWMWLTIPRLPLEGCHACGSRRAVDVPECPTCGRAWPVTPLPDP